MRSWVLAASLLAAVVSTNAQAADLDEGPPPDRADAPYDDPRYADMYRYPAPAPRYAEPAPYARPPGPPPAYRDEEDEDPGYPPPRRYSYNDPRPPYAGQCVPRGEIRARLMREGWQDFHDVDLRGELATVHARRPSGRLFAITLDRCSGVIVSARPLEARPYGPYAYGPPPRRWDRAY